MVLAIRSLASDSDTDMEMPVAAALEGGLPDKNTDHPGPRILHQQIQCETGHRT